MKKTRLSTQILIALILGVIFGLLFNGHSQSMTRYLLPIGNVFINLIQMIVIPIVIASLIIGVASIDNIKKLGKIGGKTIIYFEFITMIAIILGLLIATIVQPGASVERSHIQKISIQKYEQTAEQQTHNFPEMIINLFVQVVPKNIVQSIAKGDLLAIIFFSILFGLATAAIGERGKIIVDFFKAVLEAMFWVTDLVMKIAPIGVFSLIAVTISQFGIGSLWPLGKLVISVYVAMFIFLFVVFGLIAHLVKIDPFQFYRLLRPEILLSFTTASSDSVLPRLFVKLEDFGCSRSVISFVLPMGNTLNLAGSTLFQAMTILFIAQMYGINMTPGRQMTLFIVLMITSKGIVGVPGASFVVLIATLSALGIPAEGLAFIVGIDRILDMIRTLVNVVGNSLATIVIAKWERQFDTARWFETIFSTQSQSKYRLY
ncbi:proton glutamate symport protein [Seinonella peptonophila]|uniref:Proton glutamate symport protein n=1 Tax=Seinonella peptonophila TaxID=112248 RepID=A0A1M4TCB5_9BACL|nr:cation:dicarboxylase symporter family transporter [Seinonella peptonophila]SHE42116.1 proton glutamate symport protein [Seinonella peptonophila]